MEARVRQAAQEALAEGRPRTLHYSLREEGEDAIGVLGAVGCVLILLAAWLWGRLRSDRLADYAPPAIFGVALLGVLFLLYLT